MSERIWIRQILEMKQKRHKPEEIIRLLRDCDSSDLNQEAFCRQKQLAEAQKLSREWFEKYQPKE